MICRLLIDAVEQGDTMRRKVATEFHSSIPQICSATIIELDGRKGAVPIVGF